MKQPTTEQHLLGQVELTRSTPPASADHRAVGQPPPSGPSHIHSEGDCSRLSGVVQELNKTMHKKPSARHLGAAAPREGLILFRSASRSLEPCLPLFSSGFEKEDVSLFRRKFVSISSVKLHVSVKMG